MKPVKKGMYLFEAESLPGYKKLKELECDNSNIWDKDIVVTIFKWEKGYGFHKEIPDGYGSWTYDPEEYWYAYGCNIGQFWDLGLENEDRELLNIEDLTKEI